MYCIHDRTVAGQNVIVLGNDSTDFTAAIAPGFGGACTSLRHGGHELLHGANVFTSGAMKGRIPVLFPAVGRSFEKGELGLYRHHGAIHPMDIHGFVKDRPWREVDRQCAPDRASVTIEIGSDRDTLRFYPYDFSLAIEYVVEDTCLSLIARVRNLGGETMPFCFGYHPYFRAPIGDGRREDCIVRIPGRKIWEMFEGQPTGRQIDAPPELAEGMRLPVDHLENILTEISSPRRHGDRPDARPVSVFSYCELECPEVGKIIRIGFDEQDLETITVYSPPDSGFVCLEPRCGLPSALSDSAPVKDGMQELPAGEEFTTTVRVRVITR
ncbi:MAG: hypothetical protein GXP25_22555 [Planctomycetes bacterium]|nr:hypothetical protein [Planctomycetota bacterium]